MKVSRRRVLQVLPAAAAAPIAGQETTQANRDEEDARQRVRTSAQIVRQVQLPMSTEPAFKFVPRN